MESQACPGRGGEGGRLLWPEPLSAPGSQGAPLQPGRRGPTPEKLHRGPESGPGTGRQLHLPHILNVSFVTSQQALKVAGASPGPSTRGSSGLQGAQLGASHTILTICTPSTCTQLSEPGLWGRTAAPSSAAGAQAAGMTAPRERGLWGAQAEHEAANPGPADPARQETPGPHACSVPGSQVLPAGAEGAAG